MIDALRYYLSRLWNSPTVTTWASFAARSAAIVLVLPLAVTRLSAEEVSVWLLFASVVTLQGLADMGFGATFSRATAYAMGGADKLDDYREVPQVSEHARANWRTIGLIVATMRGVYGWLALVWGAVLLTLGSALMNRPIELVTDNAEVWCAWFVVIVTSTIAIGFMTYSAYLQGTNEIAIWRRWDALVSLLAILATCTALLLGGSLLVAVCAQQAGAVARVFVNRRLCLRVQEGAFRRSWGLRRIDPHVFSAVWPAAWRSGLGVFMTLGLIQASGFVFAQLGKPREVASYLLALSLIRGVSSVSQAPFYSKIPILARLRSQGKVDEQVRVATIGMRRSYFVYVFAFLILAGFGGATLTAIGSNTDFPPVGLWNLLGLAFFAERYGAMHIQLYSTTNHIIWHIANGVSGMIYILVSILLYPLVAVYAFPAGVLAGYVGMYCWYAAVHSYRAFDLRFWEFESACMLQPAALMLLYVAATSWGIIR